MTAATEADYERRDAWPKVEYFISDLAGVTDLQVSVEEIRKLSIAEVRTAPLIPHLAMAVVAPSDFIFGMARMWQVFARETGWNLGVFRSRSEAEAWVRCSADEQKETQG